jgi:hypothetical protein
VDCCAVATVAVVVAEIVGVAVGGDVELEFDGVGCEEGAAEDIFRKV